MSWRDRLELDGKGSFRGEEFFVSTAESTAGRRTVLHEFPGSDHVEVEDLGRATRRFTLTCYVLGPDYMTDRDKLRDAFEKAGEGPLVHPYWGEVVVAVDGPVRISETTAEGGMARFTLDVIRVTEELARIAQPDTQAEVETAVDETLDAAAEDFEDTWTTSGVIEAVRDAAQDLIDGVNGVTSVLNKVNGYTNAMMNTVDALGDSIDALEDAAATIILTASSLASNTRSLVNTIMDNLDEVGDEWADYFLDSELFGSIPGVPSTSPTGAIPANGDQRAESVMSAYRDMLDYGSDFATIDETTLQREYQAANQAAMIVLFRTQAIAETCRVIADIPFTSYDRAASIRDELADDIDDLAADADDDTYNKLVELRAAISRHLTSVSADLPRVVTYTPVKRLPALVLAQLLYGDSTKETDIIERNNIRNPCLVPGGVELEVLSDE